MKPKITKWLHEAKNKLGLQNYHLEIDWTDEEDSLMRVVADTVYLNMLVCVNLEQCKESNDKEIKTTCYHEMLHVLHWEYSDLAKDRFTTPKQLRQAEERFVQVLARILSNA